MKHNREPTAEEIEQIQQEHIDNESTPAEKQKQLLGQIIFPDD